MSTVAEALGPYGASVADGEANAAGPVGYQDLLIDWNERFAVIARESCVLGRCGGSAADRCACAT
ncbi:hypothetical protein R4282_03610 [Rhodococcus oxybenzonivorans]|uniref:hypothetical protein n=1 Tax=Rhodococcus oxybenzonivorans TaxID=1990687 RepID=UPI0029536CF1|nr:hypothetical protein [Rhodococcus oxybenzonivorans]MDV7352106.1 hypothetical protein [Rhodococcus oxybenzonivorans]